MAWIILEGLDRTGKSTVAQKYASQGYQVVHMSAPDKKYSQPGYAGPAYVDEILDLYAKYDGQDVVWDRSPYGETVWPYIYQRRAQLDDDAIDALREYEEKNSPTRILMIDPDTEAHWRRCVDNKEPLTRSQFMTANVLFAKMAHQYGFVTETLPSLMKGEKVEIPEMDQEIKPTVEEQVAKPEVKIVKTAEQLKLEKANAINQILSRRIVKVRGEPFDKIEDDIRKFLNGQLAAIFSGAATSDLTKDEVQILKTMVQRIKEKERGANESGNRSASKK